MGKYIGRNQEEPSIYDPAVNVLRKASSFFILILHTSWLTRGKIHGVKAVLYQKCDFAHTFFIFSYTIVIIRKNFKSPSKALFLEK